jgi:hypothetical protein
MLVDIAHEELIAVFLGEDVGQIKTGPAMGGLMGMVSDGLDVVIDVRVHVLPALLVIDATLNDMKEVRNYATGGKPLAHVIEVKTPRVGQSCGKDFEFLGLRMKAPDATVYELTVFLVRTRLANLRFSEYPMAPVKPTIRSPDKTV